MRNSWRPLWTMLGVLLLTLPAAAYLAGATIAPLRPELPAGGEPTPSGTEAGHSSPAWEPDPSTSEPTDAGEPTDVVVTTTGDEPERAGTRVSPSPSPAGNEREDDSAAADRRSTSLSPTMSPTVDRTDGDSATEETDADRTASEPVTPSETAGAGKQEPKRGPQKHPKEESKKHGGNDRAERRSTEAHADADDTSVEDSTTDAASPTDG